MTTTEDELNAAPRLNRAALRPQIILESKSERRAYAYRQLEQYMEKLRSMGLDPARHDAPKSPLEQVVDKAHSLQRRHFQIIADIIKSLPEDHMTRDELALMLSKRLANTSPKFKRERFLEACKP